MQGNNQSSGGGSQMNNAKQGGLLWSQPASTPTKATPVATPVTATKTTVLPPKGDASSMKKEKSSGKGGMTTLFLAGVVVGLLVGWAWSGMRSGEPVVATNTEENPAAVAAATNTTANPAVTPVKITTINTGSSGLNVSSPQDAGGSVAIAHVSVSAPTWVTVYESANGAPGRALGAQLFFPGTTSGTIELLKQTQPGTTYLVGERVDDGDHAFTPATDTAVNDDAGNRLLVTFKTN